ncbi:MAG: acetoacetate--CoA ligase [Planctomycetes bacterium]|nr:acetoacetate--CoA ligase [Planctomycetota bacterium]
MSKAIWCPSDTAIEKSQMAEFAKQAGVIAHAADVDYQQLWQWSVDNRQQFWQEIWEYCNVIGENNGPALTSDTMPGAQWFPQAQLNFAENLLQRRDNAEALVFIAEDGSRRALTFAQLVNRVRCMRHSLQQAGVVAGDRVAAFLPNVPEAIIGMLAASSLGAVWSSCSPDFGVPGVLDRFGQIEPKVLLGCVAYTYKSKVIDVSDKLRQVVDGIPSIKHVVVIPYADASLANDFISTGHLIPHSLFNDFLMAGSDGELKFTRLPFNHPLYIMFSSGTTGKPKCIVHGQGGTLLQHRKEHSLHCDLRAGEKIFYFTTTGWMMWNWLTSALAAGATVVLFDGNPFYPSPTSMFDLIDSEQINVFGTSAKFIDACKKTGVCPRQQNNLSSLRAILSTGSPLMAESFDWVYEKVKPDLMLASITGGTDLLSCFALGSPVSPVWRGEIQQRGLGMDVAVLDSSGNSVLGEAGELVCRQSFPSMPIGFWNDKDGQRYHAAYFDYFDGIWRHGDWVALTESGGLIMYGRSDATLNPGGVRIGTSEIYRQVESFPEVLEAVVVGRNTNDGDQQIVLFVVLAHEIPLSEPLQQRIVQRIRDNATARHVPTEINAVTDIPRTRSGKISEIAVRDVIHGRQVKNTEALANPESLTQFKKFS